MSEWAFCPEHKDFADQIIVPKCCLDKANELLHELHIQLSAVTAERDALKREIEEAPVVYGGKSSRTYMKRPHKTATHRARIVRVEKLEGA